MPLTIHMFPCRDSNYGYIFQDDATGQVGAIDAPDATAIINALSAQNWSLDRLFITHHHGDHTAGIEELKKTYNCQTFGPAGEADKISGLDVLLNDGDNVELGATEFEIMLTPGHTLGHICYFDAAGPTLFAADALFSLGCGRMFEGTANPMWEGLKRLRALPDETQIYCGHEYSAANAKFALSIDPDNAALIARSKTIEQHRANDLPTIPFTLGEDKLANPFLRADDPELAQHMATLSPNLDPSDAGAVFGAIRAAKDKF